MCWQRVNVRIIISEEINCAEQTNVDDYTLSFLAPFAEKPKVCEAADPNNPLCQLEGKYTVQLTGLGERTPYAHMDETCPSLPPNYTRPSNC